MVDVVAVIGASVVPFQVIAAVVHLRLVVAHQGWDANADRCQRVLVMRAGTIVGAFGRGASETEIMLSATGEAATANAEVAA